MNGAFIAFTLNCLGGALSAAVVAVALAAHNYPLAIVACIVSGTNMGIAVINWGRI